MAKLVKAGQFEGPGERQAAQYFEKHLPAGWIVVCNRELVRPQSIREVDFILIGDHVVFVIEEKHWWGPIYGNEIAWIRGGESFPSPFRQAADAGRKLAGLLKDTIPDLKRANTKIVLSRVLLTNPNVQVLVQDPRVETELLTMSNVVEEVIRADRAQQSSFDLAPYKEQIRERLAGLPARPDVPKEIGEYQVVESLPPIGTCRSYFAKHASGLSRILRLVEQPASGSAETTEIQKVALLREYDALAKGAESGVVPRVDPYFSWNEDQFWVLPIHAVDGKSLRADSLDGLPQESRIWPMLVECFGALAALHSIGIVHRALTPDRINIGSNGSIMFTNLLLARLRGEQSIAGFVDDLDLEALQRAPECRTDLGLCTEKSDVYALAGSLYYWLSGQEVDHNAQISVQLREARPDLSLSIRNALGDVLDPCFGIQESARPSAGDALRSLQELEPRVQAPTVIKADTLATDEIIAGRYKVIKHLGDGATATTYLALDQVSEHLFVLKKLRNMELSARLARTEFSTLLKLQHPNLVRVYQIYPPNEPFHLQLEYVPGSALDQLWDEMRGDSARVRRIGEEVLDALAYLEANGVVHRDISPGNILIPDNDAGNIKLIDFGLATMESDAISAVGTPPYRAPEIDSQGGTWSTACDVYSLGVVLFRALTGRLPYRMDKDIPAKSRLIDLNDAEVARYDPKLLAVLIKACAANPSERYFSAAEFRRALCDSAVSIAAQIAPGKNIINPNVDLIRANYRNSRIGNADNRGLETPFARETYVRTALDEELLPELLSGKIQLAILSGNPGDGKTAFLQQFGAYLKAQSAKLLHEDAAGWRYELGGRTYAALYDASESHGALSADDLLSDLLAPLSGSAPVDVPYVAVVAANDGRLLDFFERRGPVRFQWLWGQIQAQLYDEPRERERVVVADLKRRSLVEHQGRASSLFSNIIDQFVRKDRWDVCLDCAARYQCPIRWNALSLQPSVRDSTSRDRLHQLLLASHIRREQRATVRDLRSALSYLITNDLGCAEIHEELAQGVVPFAVPSRLYFDAAFESIETNDVLLSEFHRMDPGKTPEPTLERYFYFRRRKDQADLLEKLFSASSERPALPVLWENIDATQWLSLIKRRYFFESSAASGAASDLPDGNALFPYRYFSDFVAILTGMEKPAAALSRILRGLSRADGVVVAATAGSLALSTSESADEEGLQIIKRFDADAFALSVRASTDRYAGGIQDQLVLKYAAGRADLVVGLDLFEFLARSADGLSPGAYEHRALLEDLDAFKNQLLAHPSSELVIVEAGRREHLVRVLSDNTIELEASR